MPSVFIIRHRESGKQLFTSRGRKGCWKRTNHAKNAFAQMYWGYGECRDYGLDYNTWKSPRFDEQDVFELIELKDETEERLKRAEELLYQVRELLDNVHCYDTDEFYAITEFLYGS